MEVSILPRRRRCEGLGNDASHGNRGLSPSGTGASRREQFAALRAANGKARRTFVLRALLTLAAIYSRGTYRPTTIDVPMFHFRVRNGTGWGHWAMTTRFLLDARFVALLSLSLPGYRYRWVWVMCCCCVAFSALYGRLTSAWQCVWVSKCCVSFESSFLFKACHRGWYEVYWMLVALGSIHYCNYTCALSTWSSSTLL